MSSEDTPKNSSASSANDKQVGGTHYKSTYQHWDFVIDTQMHYLLGCATKYISRWRNKNGVEDLEKAKHYLVKAKEKNIQHAKHPYLTGLTGDFCRENELEAEEAYITFLIVGGAYTHALDRLELLIERARSEPTKAYVKQE